MSCVNSRYTADELESIFIWDCLCDAIPLTKEERRAINERDSAAKTGRPAKPVETDEEIKRRRQEYNRKWREEHKDRIKAQDAAYRARNRASINERQREYDRAKRGAERAAKAAVQAQP